MIDYIKNLLPRIQEFSINLDKKEVFVDKHWIFFDTNNNQHSYIFKRDGRLVMSLNGDVQEGKWELLPEAHSILVDRLKDKILLNQALVLDGLMYLKKDGSDLNPWILINKQVIPDLNYEQYLMDLIIVKSDLKPFNLYDGKTYYYKERSYGDETLEGCNIYDENLNQITYDTKLGWGPDKTIVVGNGIIKHILFQKEYSTDRGIVTIFQTNLQTIAIGDEAIQNGIPCEGMFIFPKNGKTKFIACICGKVTEVKTKILSTNAVVVLAVFGVISLAMISIGILANYHNQGAKEIVSVDSTAIMMATTTPIQESQYNIDTSISATPVAIHKPTDKELKQQDIREEKELMSRFHDYLSDQNIRITSFRKTKSGLYIVSPLIDNIAVRRLEQNNSLLFNDVLYRFKKITFHDDLSYDGSGNVTVTANDN